MGSISTSTWPSSSRVRSKSHMLCVETQANRCRVRAKSPEFGQGPNEAERGPNSVEVGQISNPKLAQVRPMSIRFAHRLGQFWGPKLNQIQYKSRKCARNQPHIGRNRANIRSNSHVPLHGCFKQLHACYTSSACFFVERVPAGTISQRKPADPVFPRIRKFWARHV